MSRFSKFLIATTVAAVILPGAAMAGPIGGNDTGTFSNISTCDSSCKFDSSAANGTNSEFQWGADTRSQDPSTLTADKVTVGPLAVSTSNVTIAELTWLNTPIDSDGGLLDSVKVDYTLNLGFAGSDTDLFHLTITNTVNSAGDTITSFSGTDLTALTASINTALTGTGWSVGGLAYSVDGNAVRVCNNFGFDCHNVSPTFGGDCGTNTWCNPEGDTSDLFIKANFTLAAAPTGVPEPMSLSLFGAGLIGAAGFGMRRRKKA